ncbi:MAG: ATP-binding protein [Clostridia bacterium]|nr:ATP-binding protein [Clostridia bacterium]
MFAGRKEELRLFRQIMQDDRSHFIAVYGRRRVGKTYLIREAFSYRFTFQHAGLSDGSLKEQLAAFDASLEDAGQRPSHKSANWMDAFNQLKDLIRGSGEKRKVIFIDELSWMDTPRCDLMTALENFWNGWASARKDIVLIVCASATSWLLSKVIHNKGGLYNRLTEQIHLRPFTLAECREYLDLNGFVFNTEQILKGYMIFGGVPYYWSLLQKGLSLPQNIDRLCFSRDALLKDEFRYLYASIFRNAENHMRIVCTLARKKAGMTREELIASSGLSNSGDLTLKLEELEVCGFIRKYTAFGMKKKSAVYQLIDFFTLFYQQFMASPPSDERFWSNRQNTPAVNVWNGLAFERVCLEHVPQLKEALGISGVLTEVHSWYCSADPEKGIFGSQIDLMLVRADQIINLCEMKYSATEFSVTEKTEQSIRRKIHDLTVRTGTRNAIHPILVTVYGITDSPHSAIFQHVITAEALFR